MNNLQEKHKQTMQHISQLQQEEQQLYTKLETDTDLTDAEREQLIQRVNELSQMRINMYSMLSNVVSAVEDNVNASNQTMKQSMDAIDVLETELNRTKQRINKIQEEKTNKERVIEINTYYGKQYNSHVSVMKTVVLTFIVICVLYYVLPPFLQFGVISLVWMIGAYIVTYQLFDIWYRDTINWDEYRWYFDKNAAPSASTTTSTSASSSDPWTSSSTAMGTCIGEQCCYAGTHFDNTLKMCVP